MRDVEARIESDMDPFVAGRQMDTDEIVELSALRGWLAAAVEMSYQSIGHRRIKNPRIWSLHDLDVLLASAGAQAAAAAPRADAAHSAAASRPADTAGLAIRAPSSGRYWARPAPDKPPFVSVGDVVAAGQTVCLLEVMKTFHRVTYGGPDFPERARVTAVHPQDGDDLTADQVILELAPA
jgi:acetyl-CoA carboxylase biotin carboxyl carrier protein